MPPEYLVLDRLLMRGALWREELEDVSHLSHSTLWLALAKLEKLDMVKVTQTEPFKKAGVRKRYAITPLGFKARIWEQPPGGWVPIEEVLHLAEISFPRGYGRLDMKPQQLTNLLERIPGLLPWTRSQIPILMASNTLELLPHFFEWEMDSEPLKEEDIMDFLSMLWAWVHHPSLYEDMAEFMGWPGFDLTHEEGQVLRLMLDPYLKESGQDKKVKSYLKHWIQATTESAIRVSRIAKDLDD
jgi:hypothetical protein